LFFLHGNTDAAASVRRFLPTFGPGLGTSKKREARNAPNLCSLLTFKVTPAVPLQARIFSIVVQNMKIFAEHHHSIWEGGKDGNDRNFFLKDGQVVLGDHKPKWTIAFQNVQASPFLPSFLPSNQEYRVIMG
jgi:hypothetical protein